MAKNKDYTIKEHFVPVTYLKGFSDGKDKIWKYELKDLSSGPVYVPISSICYEKDLYEVRDENGNYVQHNVIEKCLMNLEGLFSSFRGKLQSKANYYNTNTACFLTSEEKTFWKLYVAIQMLRNPIVLKNAEAALQDVLNISNMGEMAKYIAIAHCLPFNPSIPNRENVFLMRLISIFDRMAIKIGFDKQNRIITSDNPVYAYAPENNIDLTERVIFPITSGLLLELCNNACKGERNRLFEIQTDDLDLVYKTVTYIAHERIFSMKAIDNSLIHLIREARNNKEEDVKKGYYYKLYGENAITK